MPFALFRILEIRAGKSKLKMHVKYDESIEYCVGFRERGKDRENRVLSPFIAWERENGSP